MDLVVIVEKVKIITALGDNAASHTKMVPRCRMMLGCKDTLKVASWPDSLEKSSLLGLLLGWHSAAPESLQSVHSWATHTTNKVVGNVCHYRDTRRLNRR